MNRTATFTLTALVLALLVLLAPRMTSAQTTEQPAAPLAERPSPFQPTSEDPYEAAIPVAPDASPYPFPLVPYAGSTTDVPQAVADAPVINVWYGNTQTFGAQGQPQRWVNILGNVSGGGSMSLTYSLNGGPSLPLNIGPNPPAAPQGPTRLFSAGDFNIELPVSALVSGANTVEISAQNGEGTDTQVVTVNYVGGTVWPQPYAIDWSSTNNILDAAQPVDGLWGIQGGALRVLDPGYDRLIAIGDTTWKDYEVTVPVTVNSLNSSEWGSPSNGGGVGLLMRWQGHIASATQQPSDSWRDFGAIGWYRWNFNGSQAWQILGKGGGVPLASRNDRPLELGKTYIFKMSVQSSTLAGAPSTYRFKFWPEGGKEPVLWLLQAEGRAGELATGSIMLVAHQVDASFGNVEVTPLPTKAIKITVESSPNGQVIVEPNKPTYSYGDTVSIRALANNNYRLESWEGQLAEAGDTNPVVFDITRDLTVKAKFAPGPNPVLTVQTQGQGTVQVSPNPGAGGTYIYGTLVTLTPIPAAGYLFAGWSGDYSGADNPATVVMDDDKTIVARFVATPPGTVTSDDFDACTLNTALWTFIKGSAGDGSYTTNGQELLLKAPAPLSHNIWLEGNRSVRVMQKTSNNDFEIVVKFNSSVTKRFQMQGMLIEQDSNDYLRFETHHDGANVNMYAAKFVGGTPTPVIHVQLDGVTPPYLRLTRTGDQWSFSHSMNGQTWISAGSFTHKLTVASSGVFSANHAASGPSPEHVAIVDYFFNSAAPIIPEDNDTNTVNVTVNGQGTVTKNPNKADYACGETVTLTAVPSQGWTFKNWSGAVSGTETSKAVQVDGTVNVTAVFAPVGGFNVKLYTPIVIR